MKASLVWAPNFRYHHTSLMLDRALDLTEEAAQVIGPQWSVMARFHVCVCRFEIAKCGFDHAHPEEQGLVLRTTVRVRR